MPHSCVIACVSCSMEAEASPKNWVTVARSGGYNSPMDKPAEQDPRVYFAAERTFLAWIRTGLGLMGVGFAVARFGFFLRELRVGATANATPTNRLSVWSGVAIVVLGVLVNIGAVTEHFRITAQLRDGNWEPGR